MLVIGVIIVLLVLVAVGEFKTAGILLAVMLGIGLMFTFPLAAIGILIVWAIIVR